MTEFWTWSDQWFSRVLIPRIPVNGLSESVIELDPKDPADPFVMYLGDALLKNCISAISKMMVDDKADCVTSLMPVAEPQRYGIADLSEDGEKVLRCVEKPSTTNHSSNPA